MSGMRTEARNRLLMLGKEVALRRRFTGSSRGWIVVYPLPAEAGGGFRVRSFIVDADLLADENDTWDGVMHDLSDTACSSIEEVERVVESLGERPEDFDSPWNVDCPL